MAALLPPPLEMGNWKQDTVLYVPVTARGNSSAGPVTRNTFSEEDSLFLKNFLKMKWITTGFSAVSPESFCILY
jgi:hypothetical protein